MLIQESDRYFKHDPHPPLLLLLVNVVRVVWSIKPGQLSSQDAWSSTLTRPCPLQAAASAFNILFKSGGGSAVESVIPTLLSGLEGDDEQAAQALEGLRVILGVRPQTLGSMVRRILCPMLIGMQQES